MTVKSCLEPMRHLKVSAVSLSWIKVHKWHETATARNATKKSFI